MRIPKNKIQENQYTAGGEFIEKGSKTPYTGYYFTIDNNKYFIGKLYSHKAVELVKENKTPPPVPFNYQQSNSETVRYFAKKTSTQPIIIKEISLQQYNELKSNPLYKSVQIRFSNSVFNEEDIIKAEKIIKEIKLWLNFSF